MLSIAAVSEKNKNLPHYLPGKLEKGPFSGNPEGYMKLQREGRKGYYGIVPPEGTGQVIDALVTYKVLSSYQLMVLTGQGAGLKDRLNRMFELGYVDKLTTGQTPPLYVLGVNGCKKTGTLDREWDVLSVLRIAAANQFYLRFKEIWPASAWQVEPHLGLTARLIKDGEEFGILAPRYWPGENAWALEMLELAPPDRKTIIVAGIKLQAEELARLAGEREIRFTWDAALKERLDLYRRNGKVLVPEKILPKNA